VRLFVAFYLNLPFDLSTDIYLPPSAAGLLEARPLTPEQSAYLQSHIAAATSNPELDENPLENPPATVTHQEETGDRTIKGKTTFGELLAWGLAPETIEQILGMPVPDNTGQSLKDFCSANGLNFETIKPALQAEVDALSG
jgi:hypothetical protein